MLAFGENAACEPSHYRPLLLPPQVALAAAQAASTGDGGIRIASSAPIALSNPIKIKAGTGQLNYGRAVGI